MMIVKLPVQEIILWPYFKSAWKSGNIWPEKQGHIWTKLVTTTRFPLPRSKSKYS